MVQKATAIPRRHVRKAPLVTVLGAAAIVVWLVMLGGQNTGFDAAKQGAGAADQTEQPASVSNTPLASDYALRHPPVDDIGAAEQPSTLLLTGDYALRHAPAIQQVDVRDDYALRHPPVTTESDFRND